MTQGSFYVSGKRDGPRHHPTEFGQKRTTGPFPGCELPEDPQAGQKPGCFDKACDVGAMAGFRALMLVSMHALSRGPKVPRKRDLSSYWLSSINWKLSRAKKLLGTFRNCA